MHPFCQRLVTAAASRGKALDPVAVEALVGECIKGRKAAGVMSGYWLARDERAARSGIGRTWERKGPSGPAMKYSAEDLVAAREFAAETFPRVSFALEGVDVYSRRMRFRLLIAMQHSARNVEALRAGMSLFARVMELEAESPAYVAPVKVPKAKAPKSPKAPESAAKGSKPAKVGLGSFMRR